MIGNYKYWVNSLMISEVNNQNQTKMKALIIVDVQNDFCEGGALEVAGSNSIFPFINELVKYEDFSKIFVTKDWHPATHTSFAANHGKKPFEMIVDVHGENAMLWPQHCVMYGKGAQLSPLLDLNGLSPIEIRKGYIPTEESYSGFGTTSNPTKLLKILKRNKIEEVIIVGLALDYCVGNTAIDAAQAGFKVTVIEEATRSVNEKSQRQMLEKMEANGVVYTDFKTYISQNSGTLQSSEESQENQY